MKGNLGSPLQAWVSTRPPKAHLGVLSSAFQVSFQTVKQSRLGTRTLLEPAAIGNSTLWGRTKAAESSGQIHISYRVNTALADQKCYQQTDVSDRYLQGEGGKR